MPAADEERQLVLYKLLRLGPEPINNLVRCTGWPESVTRLALDQLVASDKVRRVRRNGSVPVFEVKAKEGGRVG